jgi:plasmid stabilization system protein ParE
MAFHVEVSPRAFNDLDEIARYIKQQSSFEQAEEWFNGIIAVLRTLEDMPSRCRVTVGDKVKFACVDGPEFDAHKVDFEELTRRTRAYLDQERQTREAHACQIGLGN